jgi:hypothetical protein
MATKNRQFRIVTRGEHGDLDVRLYDSETSILKLHHQIGIDDCSTNLSLRGLPVFRGLIGPMSDDDDIVRYESPEVFETLTKEWTADQHQGPHHGKGRRRRSRLAEELAHAHR